jgi:beta-N-acetylhexosaminidase
MKPLLLGVEGPVLSAEEAAFFSSHRPVGFILFKRNILDPAQVKRLVEALKTAANNPAALILIDQEGGRVQRLGPPYWPKYPSGAAYGALWRIDPDFAGEAAYLGARLMADDLFKLGINVDCLPVLDVPVPGAHDVIGDRAYGSDPVSVMAIARAAAQGLMDGAVLPVIKHIPGHGRAFSDSHHALPSVSASQTALEASDFPPFRALSDLPLAMSAHVVYTAFDAKNPATLSPIIINEVIRGAMAFDGLLMSDDLSMKALSGRFADRAAAALAAGCDLVLHCNGIMAEMIEVASGCLDLSAPAQTRLSAVQDRLKPSPRPFEPRPFERGKAQARLDSLLALGG